MRREARRARECGTRVRREPLTVVVGSDVGEQVATGGLATDVVGVVDEFGFRGETSFPSGALSGRPPTARHLLERGRDVRVAVVRDLMGVNVLGGFSLENVNLADETAGLDVSRRIVVA